MNSHCFQVGGHVFRFNFEVDSLLEQNIQDNYGPFSVSGFVKEPVFVLSVLHRPVDVDKLQLIYNDMDSKSDFLRFKIFSVSDGLLFELRLPNRESVGAVLHITNEHQASLFLSGTDIDRFLLLNSAAQLCYLLSTADKRTVMLHASAVISNEKAYLFLGKSGTGKSTHSRLWHEVDSTVQLLNDDHPVVRIGDAGKVVAYGSPWSGKTHCYKNRSAEVGAIVRIHQAKENHIRRLKPIEAYASLMTSCSGLSWKRDFADGRNDTLQRLISKVACWYLDCLPDTDAARTCMEHVLVKG